jgi:hypothetical protein
LITVSVSLVTKIATVASLVQSSQAIVCSLFRDRGKLDALAEGDGQTAEGEIVET